MLVLDGAETSGYRGVAGQWRLGVGLVVKGGGGVSSAGPRVRRSGGGTGSCRTGIGCRW